MYIQSFYKILSAASGLKQPHTLAVVRADDEEVLDAVVDAQEAHMADAILIGSASKIKRILDKHGIDWSAFQIIHETDDALASQAAVQLVRRGEADILVKGMVSTGTLMQAVIHRETGIRTRELITHMMFLQPAGQKMVCVTDGGVNAFPDLEKKKQILEHAAQVFQKFHHEQITAACICGSESLNPRLQSNLDAQALADLNPYWQEKYHMIVYGPVGLDLAISREAAERRHYPYDYAGQADILLVPNYEVGSAITKAMVLFANARSASIVLGAKVPIVLTSRSDSVESRLTSIALGCLLAP